MGVLMRILVRGGVMCASLACIATGGWAGGVGVSESPDGSGAAPQATVQFNHYRVPQARSALANRDIEFWWSEGYTTRTHPLVLPGNPSTNDLDRVGQAICNIPQNTLGIFSSDIRLAHDFLGFGSATYNIDPQVAGFLVSGIANPADGAHIDTYIYVPQVGADSGDDAGLGNRGASPSDWISSHEDTSSGHPVGDVDARNTLSLPGPAPAAVGQVSPTAWSSPDQLGNWVFDHEFQHTLNARAPGVYLSEFFSGIAEAIVGEAYAPPRFDAPHKWGMLRGNSFGPGAGLNNYAAYRDFGAYLAFNFRGADTSLTLSGVTDDLARRWAKGGSPPASDDRRLYGLRNRLSDAECAECSSLPLFAGLGPHDRLQALLHAWRVATYAKNDTLQRGLSRRYGPFGYVKWMGYDPTATVGFFQNIDGIAADDTLNIPADTTLGSWALRKSVIFEHRHRAYTPQGTGIVPTFPTTDLVPLGAEYFLVHSDSTIAASSQDLVVRLTPTGSWYGDLPTGGGGAGRMMMSIIGYNGPRSVLALRNELWKHPDYARVVTPFRAVDTDSVGGAIEATLSGFGNQYPAAVVVLSMVDQPGGVAETQLHFDVPPIPFALSLRLRNAATDTSGVSLVARSAGHWDDSPTWSPDGAQLAFMSTNPALAPGTQIFTVPAGGGTPALLFSVPGRTQMMPDWSPRGDAIVCVDVDGATGACNLRSRALVGGATEGLMTTNSHGDAYAASPAFSPNGQQIAYVQHDHGDTTTQQIRIINADGTGDHRVAYVGGNIVVMGSLRWTPSGAALVFVGDDGRTRMVFVQSGTRVDWTNASVGRLVHGLDLPTGAGRLAVVDDAGVFRGGPLPTQTFSRIALCDTVRIAPFDAARPWEPVGVRRSARMYSPRYSPDNLYLAYASDQNAAGDRDLFKARVSTDRAPAFSGLQDQGFAACVPFTMPLQATDADGDPISFQGAYLPSGSSIVNGVFRWQNPAVGTYYPVFRALDPHGGVASKVIQLTVWDDGSCGGLSGGEGGSGNVLAESAAMSGSGEESAVVGGMPAMNSMFDGASIGALGEDELLLARDVVTPSTTAILSQGKRSWFSLHDVALANITHPAGTSCDYHAGELVTYAGTRPVAEASSAGASVLDALNAGPIHLEAGQEVVITTSGTGPGVLVVDARSGAIGGDGLDVMLRVFDAAAAGGAILLDESPARREVSRRAIRCSLGGSLRLVATGPVRIAGLACANEVSGVATLETVAPVTAVSPTGADGLALVLGAGSQPLVVRSGESWELGFTLEPPPVGQVQDRWLVVRGELMSTGRTAADGSSSARADDPGAWKLGIGSVSPNPVRGQAALSFELDRLAKIEFDVLDALGRRVRRLASGAFGPGRHAQAWDRRDSSGNPVRAGVYFLKLVADGRIVVRKFAMLP